MKYYSAAFDICDLLVDIDKTFVCIFCNVFQSFKNKIEFSILIRKAGIIFSQRR